MVLSINAFSSAKCGTASNWQYMSISKDYDFSGKKNMDKAEVIRILTMFRLHRLPEPYISVEARTIDGLQKVTLKSLSNDIKPYGDGYLMSLGLILSRGLISKAILGDNDGLINLIKKQEPFYLDITYKQGTEVATVSELVNGQVLKDWYDVLEHNLEKDLEWFDKMSVFFLKKK